MRLAVDEAKPRARDFYARLGFEWTSDQRSYIADERTFTALSEAIPEPK
ncbi:hypothetical protein [Aminobacter sp. AP02]|nr:hypothetical protein [Aminobacter sp. AP02]PWK76145.1 hypothetical protein C8K44_102132 [Aminobacter sp. AP02]